MPFTLLADAILTLHFAVVLFVVGGLLFIFVGNLRAWGWVNNFFFRVTHLLAIAVVVVQSWLGQQCPLTELESWLRGQAGQSAYTRTFIEHWVSLLIYYDAPLWVFVSGYTIFTLLVVLAWLRFPPRRNALSPRTGGA